MCVCVCGGGRGVGRGEGGGGGWQGGFMYVSYREKGRKGGEGV